MKLKVKVKIGQQGRVGKLKKMSIFIRFGRNKLKRSAAVGTAEALVTLYRGRMTFPHSKVTLLEYEESKEALTCH